MQEKGCLSARFSLCFSDQTDTEFKIKVISLSVPLLFPSQIAFKGTKRVDSYLHDLTPMINKITKFLVICQFGSSVKKINVRWLSTKVVCLRKRQRDRYMDHVLKNKNNSKM